MALSYMETIENVCVVSHQTDAIGRLQSAVKRMNKVFLISHFFIKISHIKLLSYIYHNL